MGNSASDKSPHTPTHKFPDQGLEDTETIQFQIVAIMSLLIT